VDTLDLSVLPNNSWDPDWAPSRQKAGRPCRMPSSAATVNVSYMHELPVSIYYHHYYYYYLRIYLCVHYRSKKRKLSPRHAAAAAPKPKHIVNDTIFPSELSAQKALRRVAVA
jgi:hypothetical protein